MSDGSEFQVCGAATEKARCANSVRVLAADSTGVSEDRRGRTGTAGWIRSFRYAGIDDERTLNITANMFTFHFKLFAFHYSKKQQQPYYSTITATCVSRYPS